MEGTTLAVAGAVVGRAPSVSVMLADVSVVLRGPYRHPCLRLTDDPERGGDRRRDGLVPGLPGLALPALEDVLDHCLLRYTRTASPSGQLLFFGLNGPYGYDSLRTGRVWPALAQKQGAVTVRSSWSGAAGSAPGRPRGTNPRAEHMCRPGRRAGSQWNCYSMDQRGHTSGCVRRY